MKREDVYGYINEAASRASTGEQGEPVHPPIPDLDQPAPSLVDPYIAKAERHAFMGRHLPEGTRFRRLKEMLLRATRLITEDQVEFNQTVLGALKVANMDAYGRLAGLQMLVASVELAVQEAVDELERAAQRSAEDRAGRAITITPQGPGTVLLPAASADGLQDVADDLMGAAPQGGRVALVAGSLELVPLLEAGGFDPIAAEPSSLEPGSVAAVVILDCIEIMNDAQLMTLLASTREALAPGGAVVIRALDPENLVTFSRLSLMSSSARAVHPSRIASILSEVGFVDNETRPTDADPSSRDLSMLPQQPDELSKLIDLVERRFLGPRRYISRARSSG